ncbi:MAG: HigA family addiction module antidote protein [Spirochaetes bacterium]|nr:HigA family addiction module antidote protein [Spirochaetota bacterium]
MNITKRNPVHPGIILLEDVIKPLNLTITKASECMGISRKTLSELVHGHCVLTPEMAVRIGEATGTTPESWLEMQNRLSLWEAKQHQPRVKPLANVCREA